MKCPYCGALDTKVLDSRNLKEGLSIRRRRKCDECEKRFTTYESIEVNMPVIVKIDGRREEYKREKILDGISKACQKLPVTTNQIERIVDNIEKQMIEISEKEVSTKEVGHLVMMYLRNLHPVAFIRFSSVYLKYQDTEEFMNIIKHEELNFKQPVTSQTIN
jgi:transcriptional repressor NrdR